MNSTLIWLFFGLGRQSRPNRILAYVLPFFGIVFRVAQPMVKSTALKFFRLGTFLGQLILPKRNPPFDGDKFMNGRVFGRDALLRVRTDDQQVVPAVFRGTDARQRVPTTQY